MGHGYNTVLGWGVVIPIEDFLSMFPDAENSAFPGHLDGEVMEELKLEFDVGFHWERDNIYHVFVTTTTAQIVDARCGDHEDVDLEKLADINKLSSFLKTNFPEFSTPKLMLYAYEDG